MGTEMRCHLRYSHELHPSSDCVNKRHFRLRTFVVAAAKVSAVHWRHCRARVRGRRQEAAPSVQAATRAQSFPEVARSGVFTGLGVGVHFYMSTLGSACALSSADHSRKEFFELSATVLAVCRRPDSFCSRSRRMPMCRGGTSIASRAGVRSISGARLSAGTTAALSGACLRSSSAQVSAWGSI
jgi:hypothetical protein